MKKMSQKTKFRVTFLTIAFIISIVVFASTAFSYYSQIYKNNEEIKELNLTYKDKLEEEENLKDEINKIQDTEQKAKDAKEKYIYSKKGEIVIKIEE